jgi:hypothetical protein
MNGQEMVVALGAFGMIGMIVRSFFGLIGRRIDSRNSAGLSSDTEQRIARIEQAVDSIAVEVERISEGQRFTTRLLSERAAPAPAAPASPPPGRP